MKKLVYLLLACVLCSALALTACSGDSQEQSSDEGVEAEVTQTDVEENNEADEKEEDKHSDKNEDEEETEAQPLQENVEETEN